jgi:hypothetical protein
MPLKTPLPGPANNPLKDLKKGHGGKRTGAGMPKGHITQKTRDKEALRAALRQLVADHLETLVAAQIDNAKGISHFMLRDPKTGKFERCTNPAQILAALNSQDAEDGKTYYYVYTKDPSVQAFTDLMNRTVDKPVEQVDMKVTSDDTKVIARLQAARAELARFRREKKKADA